MLTPVINQNGPLPISVSVSPEMTGPATLVVAGSVWTSKANTMIGFNVAVEGKVVGTAQIFSNGPTTHRAVVPQHIAVQVDKDWASGQPASYKITLSAINADTLSDRNDMFTVTLVP